MPVGPRGHADQKSLIWAAHLLQEVLQDPQVGVLTSCSLHSRSASQGISGELATAANGHAFAIMACTGAAEHQQAGMAG